MGKSIEYNDFLNEANKVHNNKYIYNENDYKNKIKGGKFKIICPIHGEFYENYFNHVKLKRGCKTCMKEEKINSHAKYIKDVVLKKAKEIHNNKYDYSLVDITKSVKEKVKIICPIHGIFEMTLDLHVNAKQNCPNCSIIRHNFDELKKLSDEKFGIGSFEFNEKDYVRWDTNMQFKCNKCGKIHFRSPKIHLSSQGCECLHVKKIKPTNKFINFLKNHPNHIDTSLAEYNGFNKKIKLICRKKDENGIEHGEYEATLNEIMRSNTCACKKCSKREKRTTDKCIKEFKEKFGDKFIYDKFEYLGQKTSIITCPKHGDFKTNYYRMMIQKHCCPSCAKENYYYENELKKILKERINANFEYNIRPNWLKNENSKYNQEIDIFIPKYNIGIEYQGRHHFVDIYNDENKFNKTKELDYYKFKLCKKIGVKLFYFTTDKRNVPKNYFSKIYTDIDELINEIKKIIDE